MGLVQSFHDHSFRDDNDNIVHKNKQDCNYIERRYRREQANSPFNPQTGQPICFPTQLAEGERSTNGNTAAKNKAS